MVNNFSWRLQPHRNYSSQTPLSNQTLWVFPTKNSVEYTSPAVVNGVLYVGSMDGNVYAFGSTTVPQLPPATQSTDSTTWHPDTSNQNLYFPTLTGAATASIAIIIVASVFLYRQKKTKKTT